MIKSIPSILIALLMLAQFALAQEKTPASPKAQAAGEIGVATIKIVYSQPSARGRKVMGSLVPYGEVWRTGANKATTIEFDKAIKIEGKEIAAGRYALFTIPGETEWTIILNKNSDQWGAFKYKAKDDVLRVTVKPSATPEFVETFSINVSSSEVTLAWENTLVAFKVAE